MKKSNKAKVFDALVYSPLEYVLCVNEKQFKKVMKTRNIADRNIPCFVPSGGGAVCYRFDESVTNQPFILVNIPLDIDTTDAFLRRIIIHESVHVWQNIRQFMTTKIYADDDTLWEFEAYAIDAISHNLIESYFESRAWMKKKNE